MGERGRRSRVTGELVSGPETLSRRGAEEEPHRPRRSRCCRHPLDDAYYRDRRAGLVEDRGAAAVRRQLGRHGPASARQLRRLHARGLEAEMAGGARRPHWAHFYTDYGEALQKRFFGHFLKGEDNGWDKQPRVQLQVRHPGEKFVERHENEWPLARTQWTKFYLEPDGSFGAATSRPTRTTLTLRSDGRRPDLPDAAARAGDWRSPGRSRPSCSCRRRARMPTSSWCCACSRRTARRSCSRARTIRARRSASAGCAPRTASSIPRRSLPYRPYHTHDEVEPLTPGVPVELDVEIWPTCIVVPPGYRIGLSACAATTTATMAPPLKVPRAAGTR